MRITIDPAQTIMVTFPLQKMPTVIFDAHSTVLRFLEHAQIDGDSISNAVWKTMENQLSIFFDDIMRIVNDDFLTTLDPSGDIEISFYGDILSLFEVTQDDEKKYHIYASPRKHISMVIVDANSDHNIAILDFIITENINIDKMKEPRKFSIEYSLLKTKTNTNVHPTAFRHSASISYDTDKWFWAIRVIATNTIIDYWLN